MWVSISGPSGRQMLDGWGGGGGDPGSSGGVNIVSHLSEAGGKPKTCPGDLCLASEKSRDG